MFFSIKISQGVGRGDFWHFSPHMTKHCKIDKRFPVASGSHDGLYPSKCGITNMLPTISVSRSLWKPTRLNSEIFKSCELLDLPGQTLPLTTPNHGITLTRETEWMWQTVNQLRGSSRALTSRAHIPRK